LADLRNF